MGETNEIADAIVEEFNDAGSSEPEAPAQEPESQEPVADEKTAQTPEPALEGSELPEEPLAEEVTPEDRLKKYVADLEKAGLKNRAEQGSRWYEELQKHKAEVEELRKYKEERAAKEAEIAEARAKADDIIENAPDDLKSAWGQKRQENGDRWLINAHKRYLDKLRQESPEDYERETLKQQQARLQKELESERSEREKFQRELERRAYVSERDTTLRSLDVDPKEFESLAERVDGAYVTAYMKMKEQGGDPDATLKIGDVAKSVIKGIKDERERLKEQLRKEILEEAKEGGKKKPRKRSEAPAQPKGMRARDQSAAVVETLKDAIVGEYGNESG